MDDNNRRRRRDDNYARPFCARRIYAPDNYAAFVRHRRILVGETRQCGTPFGGCRRRFVVVIRTLRGAILGRRIELDRLYSLTRSVVETLLAVDHTPAPLNSKPLYAETTGITK